MKRWHVLAPNAEAAKELYDDLIGAGIQAIHIHLFAKDHSALTAARLPKPTEMEEAMVSGEGVGRLMSGIMGNAPSDPKIKSFKTDLEAGRVLMVVILPKGRADEIRDLVGRHQDARLIEAGGPADPAARAEALFEDIRALMQETNAKVKELQELIPQLRN